MAVAELPEDLPDASGSGISSHVWRGGDGQLNPEAQGVADVVAILGMSKYRVTGTTG